MDYLRKTINYKYFVYIISFVGTSDRRTNMNAISRDQNIFRVWYKQFLVQLHADVAKMPLPIDDEPDENCEIVEGSEWSFMTY